MRIPIGKVARHLGINVHHSTVIRWHRKGVLIDGKRIVLPATRFGCRIFVEEADLQEFIAKLNARPVQPLEEKAVPAKPSEAGKILDKFKI